MPLLTTQSAKGYGFSNSTGTGLTTDFVALSTVVGSNNNAVTFSSIPQGYTHLQMRCTYLGSSIVYNWANVNGDFGANYNFRQTYWDGAGITLGAGYSGITGMYGANAASSNTTPTNYILDINDYSNTSKYKNFASFGVTNSGAGGYVYWRSGFYPSTSAITSLTISADGTSTFTSDSIFTLYGIGVK